MWSQLHKIHRRLVSQGPSSASEALILYALLPISFVYGLVVWLRNIAFDCRLRREYRSSIPVVSVGNLAAGGTGKTPVVDFLVKEFKGRGLHVAILSRGYGGNFNGEAGCVSDECQLLMSAIVAGDEPYLLATRNTGVPVVIARRRKHGLRLIERQFSSVDVIILDDGFQHRAVARDINLVLLDAQQPFGNGWLLPAGLLRESGSALKRADLIIFTRSHSVGASSYRSLPAFYATYQLSGQVASLSGEIVALDVLRDLNLCAFAGIADPDSFFKSLEERGLKLVERFSFNDHTEYNSVILKSLEDISTAQAFITTEKDAVKLSAEKFHRPCYQIPLEIKISDKDLFIDTIMKKLHGDQRCL